MAEIRRPGVNEPGWTEDFRCCGMIGITRGCGAMVAIRKSDAYFGNLPANQGGADVPVFSCPRCKEETRIDQEVARLFNGLPRKEAWLARQAAGPAPVPSPFTKLGPAVNDPAWTGEVRCVGAPHLDLKRSKGCGARFQIGRAALFSISRDNGEPISRIPQYACFKCPDCKVISEMPDGGLFEGLPSLGEWNAANAPSPDPSA